MNSEIDCGVIRDLLPPYADGLASPQSRALVDAHLEVCAPCNEALEQLRNEEEAMPLPPGKALAQVKKKIKRKRLYIAVLSALTAIAVFFTGHYLIFEQEYPMRYREGDFRVERLNDDWQPDDDGFLVLTCYRPNYSATCSRNYINGDGNVQAVILETLTTKFGYPYLLAKQHDGERMGGTTIEWMPEHWENYKTDWDLPDTARLICSAYYTKHCYLLDYFTSLDDQKFEKFLESCTLIWEGDITPIPQEMEDISDE